MKLPPIPRSVFHPIGTIPVLQVVDLKDEDGDEVFGLWDPFERVIRVRKNMSLMNRWLTLWHERTHADLSEIGIVMSTDQAEAVCNAIAIARVAEMRR